MKALVVEDSRLARLELLEQLKKHSDIILIGEAENVSEALQILAKEPADILFLDIHMPQQTGFDLLERLDYQPKVIFTTAYTEYAAQSFEYDVVDYLLKPVVAKRLDKALDKARARIDSNTEPKMELESQFFVKDGERSWFIKLSEVLLFESIGNYTRIHTLSDKPLVYKSLNRLELRLPLQHFFRANRNQIVNVNQISHIDTNVGGTIELRLHDQSQLEVSRRQSVAFKKIWSL